MHVATFYICSKFQHIYVPQKTRNIYGQNFNIYMFLKRQEIYMGKISTYICSSKDKKYIWAKFQHSYICSSKDKKYIWAKFQHTQQTRNIMGKIYIITQKNIILWANFNIYSLLKNIWQSVQDNIIKEIYGHMILYLCACNYILYMLKISTYICSSKDKKYIWAKFNIYNDITQIVAKFQHSTQKIKIHGHMILYLCACNFMIIYDQKFNLHSTLHDLIST